MRADRELNDRTINGDLLKYLAKTQTDEQPGIRTNTTICLGKIAKHLGANVPLPLPLLLW
jgi:SCY1-like protein 1